MKLVITVIGKDRVGIIATVSNVLAENKVNIISINQNIMNGFFNMVLIAEMTDKNIKLQDLQKLLKEKGAQLITPADSLIFHIADHAKNMEIAEDETADEEAAEA